MSNTLEGIPCSISRLNTFEYANFSHLSTKLLAFLDQLSSDDSTKNTFTFFKKELYVKKVPQ